MLPAVLSGRLSLFLLAIGGTWTLISGDLDDLLTANHFTFQ